LSTSGSSRFFFSLSVLIDANVDVEEMEDGIGLELFLGTVSFKTNGKESKLFAPIT
jgi:hypothetical protein